MKKVSLVEMILAESIVGGCGLSSGKILFGFPNVVVHTRVNPPKMFLSDFIIKFY